MLKFVNVQHLIFAEWVQRETMQLHNRSLFGAIALAVVLTRIVYDTLVISVLLLT